MVAHDAPTRRTRRSTGCCRRQGKLGAQQGTGGARVVIEEFLEGEEASFIVLCDGRNVLSLATSQDHKRLLDGDPGPNTGGMGAYSPAPVVTPNVHAKVMHEIIHPTLAGMAGDGMPFTGFLYAGLMIDAQGRVKTLEFNTRLGDPEAQPILMRLKSDLFEVLMHAADGTLDQVELEWDRRVALGVVMAAHGYPLAPRKGDAIAGLPAEAPDAMVFHAGTALQGKAVLTAGGRVLCVTALGDSVKQAQQRAYDVLRRHPLRRRAVPRRHRLSRHQALNRSRRSNLRERPVQFEGSALARAVLRLAGWRIRFDGLPARAGRGDRLSAHLELGFRRRPAGEVGHRHSGDVLGQGQRCSGSRCSAAGCAGSAACRWTAAQPHGIVGQMVEALKAARRDGRFLWLALAPEGTRRLTEAWRSGLLPRGRTGPGAARRWSSSTTRRREVGFERFLMLSGDRDADMAAIARGYGSRSGLRPQRAAPIRLEP